LKWARKIAVCFFALGLTHADAVHGEPLFKETLNNSSSQAGLAILDAV